jgi:NitT/TauT family transport system substrate-binding protein
MPGKLMVAMFKSIFCLLICLLLVTACKRETHAPKTVKTPNVVVNYDSTAMHKVTLQLQWLHQSQFAGFYVAYKKGFYRNYGFDVNIKMGGPLDASPEIVSKRKAEFGTMFLTSALREIDHGNSIVNIAQLSQKSSQLLVAKKSSGILKINDINGKKVGIWANDFYEPTLIFLSKYKIKATIIPISWTTNVLAQDVVDIMNMMLYNEYNVFINTGYDPKDLTVFQLSDYGVNIPEDGIYCHRDYYKENPTLCHDFAEASRDGWFYALNHEEETLSMVLAYLKEAHLPANIPHQRWMFQKIKEAILYKPEQFGRLTEQDYNSSVQMMKQNGLLKHSIPYSDFIGYADAGKK